MEKNKLEIKHLACYLPYGLKVKTDKGIGVLYSIANEPLSDCIPISVIGNNGQGTYYTNEH